MSVPSRPDHPETEPVRDEVFNRVARLSALLDAQEGKRDLADEVVARALLIAAETDVHSRRGRDLPRP